jgi:hypothetical protein
VDPVDSRDNSPLTVHLAGHESTQKTDILDVPIFYDQGNRSVLAPGILGFGARADAPDAVENLTSKPDEAKQPANSPPHAKISIDLRIFTICSGLLPSHLGTTSRDHSASPPLERTLPIHWAKRCRRIAKVDLAQMHFAQSRKSQHGLTSISLPNLNSCRKRHRGYCCIWKCLWRFGRT